MPAKDLNNQNLPAEEQQAIVDIYLECEREDNWVRRQQIRVWKKLERFWHGIQYIYWSETQQDWIAPIDTSFNTADNENREDAAGPYYDFVMNIYRGHGESIIAALAAQMPSVRFPPDNADDEDDRLTSQVFSKISDLIDRHNQSKLVIFQALLALWNQGIVCAYHYNQSDPKYGFVKIPVYGTEKVCDTCGYMALSSEEIDCPECLQNSDPANSDESPDQDQSQDQDQEPEETEDDEYNGSAANPTSSQPQGPKKLTEHQVIKGFNETQAKSRVKIDIFGPIFVKIPTYAKTQEQCDYVINCMEQPRSLVKYTFASGGTKRDVDLAQKIDATGTEFDIYERTARAPSAFTYTTYDNQNLVTFKRIWLRPSCIERLGSDKEDIKKSLRSKFPKGIYACFVGRDVYIESRSECLDDKWTIGKAGLSTYIHSDPMGQPLVPAQEMKNVYTNLSIETVEQGIADVYADPDVLNFEDYSRHEKRPGNTYAVSPKPGIPLSASIMEGPKATLSAEVPELVNKVEQDAQFLVASFPSIYGGPQEEASKTATEYNMSRQMALQRLSITWTLLTIWWAKLKEKCVHLYVENIVEDERFVTKDSSNNYVNVWIRKADLLGKVGEVEPEGGETFPVTMAQKQSTLMQILALNNQIINNALFSSENYKVFTDSLGFPELKLPQDDQRIKQVRENQYMLDSNQLAQIEPILDDDDIHIQTAKDYLVSEEGQSLKDSNVTAYQLIIQHIQLHQQNKMQSMQPPVNPNAPPGQPVQAGNPASVKGVNPATARPPQGAPVVPQQGQPVQ